MGVFLFFGYLLFDLLRSEKSQDTEILQDINGCCMWLIKTISCMSFQNNPLYDELTIYSNTLK